MNRKFYAFTWLPDDDNSIMVIRDGQTVYNGTTGQLKDTDQFDELSNTDITRITCKDSILFIEIA